MPSARARMRRESEGGEERGPKMRDGERARARARARARERERARETGAGRQGKRERDRGRETGRPRASAAAARGCGAACGEGGGKFLLRALVALIELTQHLERLAAGLARNGRLRRLRGKPRAASDPSAEAGDEAEWE